MDLNNPRYSLYPIISHWTSTPFCDKAMNEWSHEWVSFIRFVHLWCPPFDYWVEISFLFRFIEMRFYFINNLIEQIIIVWCLFTFIMFTCLCVTVSRQKITSSHHRLRVSYPSSSYHYYVSYHFMIFIEVLWNEKAKNGLHWFVVNCGSGTKSEGTEQLLYPVI